MDEYSTTEMPNLSTTSQSSLGSNPLPQDSKPKLQTNAHTSQQKSSFYYYLLREESNQKTIQTPVKPKGQTRLNSKVTHSNLAKSNPPKPQSNNSPSTFALHKNPVRVHVKPQQPTFQPLNIFTPLFLVPNFFNIFVWKLLTF